MEDKRYIYSAARVRVLECSLMHREIFLSMASAPILEDTLSALSETGVYPAEVMEIKNSMELDSFINEQYENLLNLASELFVDKTHFDAFKNIKSDVSLSYSLIKQTKSPLLIDFIKKFIDLYNIKSYFRITALKKGSESLAPFLVDGGYIQKEAYISNFGKMSFKNYADILKEGIDKINTENDFSLLEKQIEDYIITILRNGKHLCFGPEPVFGYCYAKQSELDKIKLIVMSKISKVSQSYIDERLTLSYA